MGHIDNVKRGLEESIRKWEQTNSNPENADEEFEKLMKQFKDHLLRDFYDRNKKYFK